MSNKTRILSILATVVALGVTSAPASAQTTLEWITLSVKKPRSSAYVTNTTSGTVSAKQRKTASPATGLDDDLALFVRRNTVLMGNTGLF